MENQVFKVSYEARVLVSESEQRGRAGTVPKIPHPHKQGALLLEMENQGFYVSYKAQSVSELRGRAVKA